LLENCRKKKIILASPVGSVQDNESENSSAQGEAEDTSVGEYVEHSYSSDEEDDTSRRDSIDEDLAETDFASLDAVFTNPAATSIFEQFLETNNCKHLMLFLREVATFKELDDPVVLADRAQAIYTTYCSPKSSQKINFEDDILQQLQEKEKLLIWTEDSFNPAQLSVFSSMQTVYFPLFLQSKTYQQALEDAKSLGKRTRRVSKGGKDELLVQREQIISEIELLEQEEKEINQREQELIQQLNNNKNQN